MPWWIWLCLRASSRGSGTANLAALGLLLLISGLVSRFIAHQRSFAHRLAEGEED